MPGPDAMAAAPSKPSSRKTVFLALQALVVVEAVVFVVQAAFEFIAAGSGDAIPLLVSGILLLLAGSLVYTAITLRSRASTPFFTTLVASLFGLLILASLGGSDVTRLPGIALTIAVIVALALLRNSFHLRPGEVVKEEMLPPEVAAKIATKVRGVRCRECGDDDVWITSEKQLVCRNCGTTNA